MIFAHLIIATLKRDFSVLTSRRSFWWALSLWSFICSFIFFAYTQDFLAIQPRLRAKNIQYGVTDLVIIPYIKTLGLLSLLFIIGFCSRLFYNEQYADFSKLYLSTQPKPVLLVTAKIFYIMALSLTIISLVALPPLVSHFFFDYNLERVVITLLAQFVLLLTTGLIATVISQRVRHSILVMLIAGSIILSLEFAARLFVDPAWFAPFLAYFSPIAHTNRIATGMFTLSDGVFFITLWMLLGLMAIRKFNNTYLTLS